MSWHAWAHFLNVSRHRRLVRQFCRKSGIAWQGLTHDLSKYHPAEFIPGAKYYLGQRSPNEAERRAQGYSKAWLRHKGRNRHHLEYWTDYPLGGGAYTALRMPLRYIVESVCDRIAACRVYNGSNYQTADAYDYYLHSLPYYLVHEETDRHFQAFLQLVKDAGEEACFAEMKAALRTEAKVKS